MEIESQKEPLWTEILGLIGILINVTAAGISIPNKIDYSNFIISLTGYLTNLTSHSIGFFYAAAITSTIIGAIPYFILRKRVKNLTMKVFTSSFAIVSFMILCGSIINAAR